jgi:hypothetical protein
MLDVHPAHHAASTWRDFFIHIATIALGLLIAIGLEQTVESLHHRSQAREARTQLFEELHRNQENAKDYESALDGAQQRLREGMDAISRARKHASRPEDRVVTMQGFYRIGDSAWTTVHGSNATEYMNQRELAQWAALYDLQAELNRQFHDAMALEQAFAPLVGQNPESVLSTKQTGEIEGGPLDLNGVLHALSAQKHLETMTAAQLDSVQLALESCIVANQGLQRNLAWLVINYTRFERDHPET